MCTSDRSSTIAQGLALAAAPVAVPVPQWGVWGVVLHAEDGCQERGQSSKDRTKYEVRANNFNNKFATSRKNLTFSALSLARPERSSSNRAKMPTGITSPSCRPTPVSVVARLPRDVNGGSILPYFAGPISFTPRPKTPRADSTHLRPSSPISSLHQVSSSGLQPSASAPYHPNHQRLRRIDTVQVIVQIRVLATPGSLSLGERVLQYLSVHFSSEHSHCAPRHKSQVHTLLQRAPREFSPQKHKKTRTYPTR